MIKPKVSLVLENLDQLSNLNIDLVFLVIFLTDIYSSYLCIWILISIVAVIFYYLTTGTKSFIYVFAKVVSLKPSEITQFADQIRIWLTSQLIKDISRVLQKILKYLNCLAIFAFIILSLLVFSKTFD